MNKPDQESVTKERGAYKRWAADQERVHSGLDVSGKGAVVVMVIVVAVTMGALLALLCA